MTKSQDNKRKQVALNQTFINIVGALMLNQRGELTDSEFVAETKECLDEFGEVTGIEIMSLVEAAKEDYKTPGLMTTQELAAHLNVHRMTLLEWRKKGMPHTKLAGGAIRYDLAAVQEWIEKKNAETA